MKKLSTESANNSWLYNDEKRIRGIWYLIIPIICGLIFEWFFKLPLSSFNWPIFLLFSISCLLSLSLSVKEIRFPLYMINRDVKIVFTTILVLLIIVIFKATEEYTYYVAEYFSIENSYAKDLWIFNYILIWLIVSLWGSQEDS